MSADSGSRELISVVVPSFNQGRWINECLHSLFAQADANLVVIVIDGGSTDSTLAVLEHWRPRLAACISEPDRGQAHAIAKGFALARGELLSWLNSDDMHLPWTIRAWRSAFSRDPSREMLHGNRIIMDASAIDCSRGTRASGSIVSLGPIKKPRCGVATCTSASGASMSHFSLRWITICSHGSLTRGAALTATSFSACSVGMSNPRARRCKQRWGPRRCAPCANDAVFLTTREFIHCAWP